MPNPSTIALTKQYQELMAGNRYLEAIQVMNRILGMNPQDNPVRVHKARALAKLDRLDEAEEILVNLSLQTGGAFPMCEYEIGYIQYLRGDYKDAKETLRHAVSELPHDHFKKFLYADTLYHLEEHNEALAVVDELLERLPKSIKAHRLRGDILTAVGRDEEAKAEFERAAHYESLPKAPKSEISASHRLARIANDALLQHLGDADKKIELALADPTLSLSCMSSLAYNALEAKKPLLALKVFDRILSRKPDAKIMAKKAKILWGMHARAQAIEVLDQALALNPSCQAANALSARIGFATDERRIDTSVDTLLQHHPEMQDTAYLAALRDIRGGDYHKAFNRVKTACEKGYHRDLTRLLRQMILCDLPPAEGQRLDHYEQMLSRYGADGNVLPHRERMGLMIDPHEIHHNPEALHRATFIHATGAEQSGGRRM